MNTVSAILRLQKSSHLGLFKRTSSVLINKNSALSTCTELSVFRNRDSTFSFNQGRTYSTNQTNPKQTKNGTGFKVFKYVSGIIGACILSAVGVREYWKRKYRAKGLEPVKEFRFGWKHTSYYYGGYKVPDFVVDCIEDIPTFKVREDDVWIIGFPKSGTTWVQEVIYLIAHDVDLESVKSKIEDRISFFEHIYPGIKGVDKKPSPRFIKTHIPFSVLPSDYHVKKPKTVYIARNPKDVVVSSHYFLYKFFVRHQLELTFDEYCQLFVEGNVSYGPWWKHVKEGWEKRNDDNVLYITYEDMKMDFPGAIRKIATFLGKKLSDKDVEAVAHYCSFEQMRNNNYVNKQVYKDRGIANKDAHFMRKGKVGDWKNHLSTEITTKLDEIVKTELEPLGIGFKDTSKADA